jgi:S-methylmethionine-dependent homocysteine/selenocysteine methylase
MERERAQLDNQEFTVLDGPVGTQLAARGVATPAPLWSAAAIESAPEILTAIHREYAQSGATVHTANTFRTHRRAAGEPWERLTRRAVALARGAVPADHRVAGSLAPLEDCYRPDLSPIESYGEHHELAACLADSGCDLILCETFPHGGEALQAVRAAVATGLPVWLALTAGPRADLMKPDEMAAAARAAVGEGAQAILVNCTPATVSAHYVAALAGAGLNVPIGCYANAGSVEEGLGWGGEDEHAVRRYAACAEGWIGRGARLIGGCCGTGPAHIAALARLVAARPEI